MSISRVRIEAEDATMDGVLEDLNQAFGLFYGSRFVPRESEFVEEVIESHIMSDGAVRYQGRRVIRFDGDDHQMAEPLGDPPTDGNPNLSPVSWVISGNATTATAYGGSAVWNVGVNTANSMSIFPDANWQIRDACGTTIDPTNSVAYASDAFIQPFYFNPSPGIGG